MRRTFAPDVLAGEVAVITGGSSGIGLGVATAFASHGAEVVIISRSAERLAAAAASVAERTGRRCATYVCDVRDDETVAAVRDQVRGVFGTTTVLVNNAAANFRMAAEDMTRRAFTTVLDIDLIGTFTFTTAFVADMIREGSGSVVNVVVPDAERGFPGYAHAGAAKAGIISLTRTWAREWGPYGVRVNAVGPGLVPTEGVATNMLGLGKDDVAEAWAEDVDRIPLGRLGAAEDIASAITFLCSPAASWITGVSLTVDGGMNLM